MRTDSDLLSPQALDLERAILGAMLTEARAIADVAEVLGRDGSGWFYHRRHELIYEAAMGLHEADRPVDQLTVGQQLERRRQLAEAGGVAYLAELAGGVASAANAAYHARIVLEKGLARRLAEICTSTATQACQPGVDVFELIDRASSAMFDLAERRQGGDFVPHDAILPDTIQEVERAHANPGALTGVDTGLTDLNAKTGGLQAGDLILLAARPSVGKTALALSCVLHAALEARIGVGVFSLEMSRRQVSQRLLAMAAGVDLHRMRTGLLSPAELLRLAQATSPLDTDLIHIDDTAGLSILEVRARARRLVQRRHVRLLVVDYLGLMTAAERKQSREQEVSDLSRGLKLMAKELDLPVLALSQLSRAPEARSDRRPQLSDLRDSGSLEQDADIVLFLFRPEMYGMKGLQGQSLAGIADVTVAKQRNGPAGPAARVMLQFDATSTRYRNLAHDRWAALGLEDPEGGPWPQAP